MLSGTYHPEGFIGLYKWPTAAAPEQFGRDPRWPPIKATRPEVFRELRVSTIALEEDLAMTFKDDHVYEIQVLWLAKNNADAYSQYVEAMNATLDEMES